MKILVPLLLLTSAASAQGFLQNPQFGIRGVTRRTPMVIPQIEANQFFAAGGIYVAGQPLGNNPGTQTLQVSPPLVESDAPPAPTPESPRPVIAYRAPAKPKAMTTGGSPTNAVAAKSKYDPATSGAVIRSHWAGSEPPVATTPTIAAVETK